MEFIEREAIDIRVVEIEATAKEVIGTGASLIDIDQGHSDRF